MWCHAVKAIKRLDENEKRKSLRKIQLNVFLRFWMATIKLHCPSKLTVFKLFFLRQFLMWVWEWNENRCRNCVVFDWNSLKLKLSEGARVFTVKSIWRWETHWRRRNAYVVSSSKGFASKLPSGFVVGLIEDWRFWSELRLSELRRFYIQFNSEIGRITIVEEFMEVFNEIFSGI